MLLKELQSRDVVNVKDGSKLGKITDIELDYETGKINSLTISKNKGISGIFGTKTITLLWNQILKIGGEVIIVDVLEETV